ncbi:MAG: YdcH family protein [Polyangia bacterium]
MTDIDSLRQRHKQLEEALAAIDAHLSLTSKEQAERIQLKKEKLAIKDRIQLLLAK